MDIKNNLHLILLGIGVLGSFTIFGYAQEALTRGEYDGERFKFPTFLILIQSLGNITFGFAGLLFSGEKTWSANAPPKHWAIVSSAYLGAHEFGLWALAFIPFPLQVVCKSCKAVPVMIGETLFARKKHSFEKKLQVLLMVFGVVVFTLAGGNKKGGNDDWALTPSLMFGLLLVIGALVCDGIYGPYQMRITKEYNANQFHLMFNMNLYEFFLALPLCMVTGEFTGALDFISRHPEIITKMAYFGATMSLGSLFVFAMQAKFGALTVTLTTTLRKLISVIFSVFWFGHQLEMSQWGAACIVFLAAPIAKTVVKVIGGEAVDEKKGEEKKTK